VGTAVSVGVAGATIGVEGRQAERIRTRRVKADSRFMKVL